MSQLERIIEAALFAAPKPLTIKALQKLFIEEAQPSVEEIQEALETLASHYAQRGICLKEVSTGYRFQVHTDVASELRVLFEEKPARYSRAMLETLALIAYRQPITRAEVEEVRGVVVSTNIVKTLLEHEWIRVVGHKDVPGRPALFATTKAFLDHFNLKSLDELPPLSQIVDLEKVGNQAVTDAAIEAQEGTESTAQTDETEAQTLTSSEDEAETEMPEISTSASDEASDEDDTVAHFESFSEIVVSASVETEESNDSDVN
jgi:segregation and condensation protein B